MRVSGRDGRYLGPLLVDSQVVFLGLFVKVVIDIPDSPVLDVVAVLAHEVERVGLIIFGKIVLDQLLMLSHVRCLGFHFFAFAGLFAMHFLQTECGGLHRLLG